MNETWLRPNRRAIWFGCVPPLLLAFVGAWVLGTSDDTRSWSGWLGAVLMIAGLGTLAMLLRQLRHPRIGYRDRHVLFYLRAGPPIAVPAKTVEAFFLGQGPAMLPGDAQNKQRTVNLVARLSQRDTGWARREVKPALGKWCDGYVTIRGAWCEPLDADVVRRLNRRLKEVQSQIDAVE